MTCSAPEVSTSDSVPSEGGTTPIRREQYPIVDAPGFLAIAGAVVSQAALIGGLLYYFGWIRTQAALDYFGLGTGLIGYSSSDYLLRSIGVIFLPFVQAALAALVLLSIHQFVVRWALRTPTGGPARRIGRRLVILTRTVHMIAVALAALVIIGLLFRDQVGQPLGLALPLLLIGSVGLLGYALYLRMKYVTTFAARRLSYPRAQALVLLALGLLGMMWAVGLHAEQAGKRAAAEIVAGLPTRPAVILYSSERISVAGTGVEVAEIAQPGSKYRYQYSGIRLLARSADTYLLLPVEWQRGRDRVFIVPDDDSIRIDIAAR